MTQPVAKYGNRHLVAHSVAGALLSFLLMGCPLGFFDDGGGGSTTALQEQGEAATYVQAALAALPAAGDYNVETIDFSAAQQTAEVINDEEIQFERSDGGGFTLVSPSVCTEDAPASCVTYGSRSYLELETSGAVYFDSPRRVLGMHISLSGTQAENLEELSPEQGDDYVLNLPQFRVVVTGVDDEGEIVSAVRAIPASATYAETRVDQEWSWVDTSLLGEVSGLVIEAQSPIAGISSILIDNLTTSGDFVASEDFFAIALLPDTQKYVETAAYREIFESQTEYLALNKDAEQIVFVSHLGDIVENGDIEPEWIAADAAMSTLDGVLPYGIVVGNHDYEDEWEHPELGSPYFLNYFPETRFSSYPWWIGASSDGLSSCQLFETPVGDFLYFHLSVDSPPPTVEWAQQVIDAHPGTPTLVTTHAYLRENGRIPVPYLSSVSGDWDGISADELFETFIAPNNQIFMVTCGHISAEYHQLSDNDSGKPVHELLQDYQNRENGGEGFLRLMRFYPNRDEVRMLTYSPWLKTYEIDSDSHFSIELDFDTRL